MKIGWGWKIAVLYSGFAAMIVLLVVLSTRQHFDLVSTDYYKDEIAYQKVLDASHNQAGLAGSLDVHANGQSVTIEFPAEFKDKVVHGDVTFYSAVNQEWDRSFPISANHNSMAIPREKLKNTSYTVKVTYSVDGKDYYQESHLYLHS